MKPEQRERIDALKSAIRTQAGKVDGVDGKWAPMDGPNGIARAAELAAGNPKAGPLADLRQAIKDAERAGELAGFTTEDGRLFLACGEDVTSTEDPEGMG
jgi:hypothetical protein